MTDIEKLAKDAIAKRADAIDVQQPMWADVLDRQPAHASPTPSRRALWALTLSVLVGLLAAAAVILANGGTNAPPAATTTTTTTTIVRPGTFTPVLHTVTSSVRVVYEDNNAETPWRLITFQSNLGPCVGVQPIEAAAQPLTRSGFPAASSECAPAFDDNGMAAFHVAVARSGRTDSDLRPVAARFVVGLAQDATSITASIGGGGQHRPVTRHAGPFDRRLTTFFIPVDDVAVSVELKSRGRDGAAYARHSQSNVIGPGVIVATSGSILLTVHDDAEFFCVTTDIGGACARGGALARTRSGADTRTYGTTELGATEVRLYDEAGAVVATLPTFGCERGYGLCFFALAHNQEVRRVEAFDAAGNSRIIGNGSYRAP